MHRRLPAAASLACVLATSLALAGCGSLPRRTVPEPVAVQGDLAATALARIARASRPAGSPSGFRLLPQAGQAFEAREQLIARAEKTLDIQYYFIAADGSGHAFLRGLEAAAARGVRVRLLVDDLHTGDVDPELARLARLPGFEVRLFNPFCCARASVFTRFAASLSDLHRLDRRMHNKLLVADGALAIAGGRNIADEYFGRSPDYEFIDIDALLAGDIVAQLESVFLRYWQSDAAWPAQDILAPGSARPREAEASHKEPGFPSVDVLGQRPAGIELAAGRLHLVPGTAYAFADPPSKALDDGDQDYLQQTSVTTRAREALLTAQSEVVIATPYLIPRTKGMAFITNLHHRGVRVQVLTNGAASNDSQLAHAAYARYRPRMLAQGVELHEVSARASSAAERAGPGLRRWDSAGRLHAKAFVIDRQTVFLGSMNLDPRSADKNTELGILVESPPLAAQMVAVIDAYRRLGSLRVTMDDATRQLHWTADDGAEPPRQWSDEPGVGFLGWLAGTLVLPWIPEALL